MTTTNAVPAREREEIPNMPKQTFRTFAEMTQFCDRLADALVEMGVSADDAEDWVGDYLGGDVDPDADPAQVAAELHALRRAALAPIPGDQAGTTTSKETADDIGS